MPTGKLSAFVCNTSYNDIPLDVIEHGKLVFLDWLGVTLAGSRHKMGSVMADMIAELDGENGPQQAAMIGKGIKTDMIKAALANGSMSHVLDLDDYHAPTLCHPTVAFLPALLAVAEYKKLSGKDLLAALVIAFDILVRVGYGAKRLHYDRGWHATSTLGKFGAAAGAGKLLNLDVETLANAFGIAGTTAGGLRLVFGNMGKSFHAGKAAMDGVLAAILAQKGFDCSKNILEGKHGFMDLFSDDPDMDKMLDKLGEFFHLPTVSFKPYASCGATHSTIDLMKEIRRRENINTEDVEEIILDVTKIAGDASGQIEPKSGLEGKFSVYFCAALALSEGEAGIDKFTDEKVNDPQLVTLRKKVKLNIIPDLELAFRAKALVKMKDGIEYMAETDAPRGSPLNPISYMELAEKFKGLASNVIPDQNVEKLIALIENLDKLQDVGELMGLCSCKPGE